MMPALTPLMPAQPVPDLAVATTDGGTWRLSERTPKNFSLIVIYRGLHCPICKKYLLQFQDSLGDFADRGVDLLVLSSDDEARAKKSVADWGLGALTVGYGLSHDDARRWGLYLSKGRPQPDPAKIAEPAIFAEPGLFLVRPDGTLFFGSVQTMPFTRPPVAELLKGIDHVLANDYPPRGTVVDHTKAA